ncbi:MAG: hypothetical protein H0U57_07960 [Tatlockia sp.]|nr:hypothetical protein [Tatlockia sp.]
MIYTSKGKLISCIYLLTIFLLLSIRFQLYVFGILAWIFLLVHILIFIFGLIKDLKNRQGSIFGKGLLLLSLAFPLLVLVTRINEPLLIYISIKKMELTLTEIGYVKIPPLKPLELDRSGKNEIIIDSSSLILNLFNRCGKAKWKFLKDSSRNNIIILAIIKPDDNGGYCAESNWFRIEKIQGYQFEYLEYSNGSVTKENLNY